MWYKYCSISVPICVWHRIQSSQHTDSIIWMLIWVKCQTISCLFFILLFNVQHLWQLKKLIYLETTSRIGDSQDKPSHAWHFFSFFFFFFFFLPVVFHWMAHGKPELKKILAYTRDLRYYCVCLSQSCMVTWELYFHRILSS